MNIPAQPPDSTGPFIDASLARRLERTEAHANMAFVESRARLEPAVGAQWQDVGGTWVMFDGAESPLTQTFGLGLFSGPTAEQFEQIENVFSAHRTATLHEVCTMADAAVLPLLGTRGYVPTEWSTVLVQPLPVRRSTQSGDVAVREIRPAEADLWADVAAAGWSEEPALADFIRALGRVSVRAEDTRCYLALLDGQPVASASMHVHNGVALLAGASTIPPFRRRGAQNALLVHRLAAAADLGCDLAMMVTAPGSDSQRNAQRSGFSVAYSRVKWCRELA
ncbi:GNAT family N-acetyltransferase [Gemmatimonas sp.]